MIFFDGDQHHYHRSKSGGIIAYCNRPFADLEEMTETLIANSNEVVRPKDTVIHAGDFSMGSVEKTVEIIKRLNGKHIFIKGSHDKVIQKIARKYPDLFEYAGYIYELRLHNKYHVVVCHYCLRTWPRSHYNSWHVFAHSHCRLKSIGKSHDIGVDCNNYYPYPDGQIIDIMNKKPDNPNYMKRGRGMNKTTLQRSVEKWITLKERMFS